MKTSLFSFRKFTAAFTLIELLVVIAIIGILAAMLFPAINRAKIAAQVGRAKVDIKNLETAINKYEADYNGRFPAPNIESGAEDVTYGYATNTAVNGLQVVANNSNVVAVLLNLETFADGRPTINKGRVFNPRGLTSLPPNPAKDVESGGVGPDGEFRDPWGKPYVISMDTSMNDHVRDNLYSRATVSLDGTKILNSLSTNTANTIDPYGFRGSVMIWSRGPDGQATPAARANTGVNRDNVLGWQ